VRDGITDAECDRAQQQVHRAVPAFGFDLVDACAVAACAGIVENDVDASGFSRGPVHQGTDGAGIGDIGDMGVDRTVGRSRRRGEPSASMSAA
jgi:hypothetical protein